MSSTNTSCSNFLKYTDNYNDLSQLQKRIVTGSGVIINVTTFFVTTLSLYCVRKQHLYSNRDAWNLVAMLFVDFVSSTMLSVFRLMVYLNYTDHLRKVSCVQLILFLIAMLFLQQLPIHALLLLVRQRYQKINDVNQSRSMDTGIFLRTVFGVCGLLNGVVSAVVILLFPGFFTIYCSVLFGVGCYYCVVGFRMVRKNGYMLGTKTLQKLRRAMRLSSSCLLASVLVFCLRTVLTVLGARRFVNNGPFLIALGFNLNFFPSLCNGLLFLSMDRFTKRIIMKIYHTVHRYLSVCTTSPEVEQSSRHNEKCYKVNNNNREDKTEMNKLNTPAVVFKLSERSKRRKVKIYPNRFGSDEAGI